MFKAPIPILRSFDEQKAKEFYIGTLGLELDEHTIKAAHDAKDAMDLAWGRVDTAWAPQVVKITKLVHEYGARQKQLHYTNRFGKKLTVPVNW